MRSIPRPLPLLVVLGILSLIPIADAGTVRVGVGEEHPTVSAAAQRVRDGDTVEIVAGDYTGDVAIWTANNITIRGVGGRPHIQAAGHDVEGKGTWVIKGNDVVIDNIELSGARVSDKNGAAIRVEGRNLAIRNCFIHHNENGILAGDRAGSTISIESSEFAHNGHGDGRSHGIYVGDVQELAVSGSYLHHAHVGHNVKSRAVATMLYYNRIADERDGDSSYLVDAPNGGRLVMVGNILQQGVETENYTLVNFGAEGITHDVNEIYLVNNTLVNLRAEGSIFVRETGATAVRLINNIFWGTGEFDGHLGQLDHNLKVNGHAIRERLRPTHVFRDVEALDFRLTRESTAVDVGVEPGRVDHLDLNPRLEYVHPASTRARPREGPLDLGALEYSNQ